MTGGIEQELQDTSLSVLRDAHGKVQWKKTEASLREEFIRSETLSVVNQFGPINADNLKANGFSWLYRAIINYYPGRFGQLMDDIGIVRDRKHNYWTPERIETEARLFLEEYGNLSQPLLNTLGRSDLITAIDRHYLGKLSQLQINLGVTVRKTPDGYWTTQNIEREAEIFAKQGDLSFTQLKVSRMTGLAAAIRKHYPGGLRGLASHFGVELKNKPKKYWTKQKIEEEAKAFFQQEKTLSGYIIRKKMPSLAGAISKRYPGRIKALRQNLGIDKELSQEISQKQANQQLRGLLEGEQNE